jgi:hypothetical protein
MSTAPRGGAPATGSGDEPASSARSPPQPPLPAPVPPRQVPTPPPPRKTRGQQQAQRRPGRLPRLRQDTGFFAPVEPIRTFFFSLVFFFFGQHSRPHPVQAASNHPHPSLVFFFPHNNNNTTAAADLASPLAAVMARDPTVKGGRWDPEFVWNTDWERAVRG